MNPIKISRRNFLKTSTAAILTATGTGLFPLSFSKAPKPNIIFLLADDMVWQAAGCYGNKEALTPEIDRLSRDGITFDNHFNTTSICMASRANIMTGMLEYKSACNFMHGSLSADKFEKSYPVLLRKSGYFTGFAGKFGFPVTPEPDKNIAHKSWDRLPVKEFDQWAGGLGQTSYHTAKNEYIKNYADEYPHSSRAYGAWSADFLDKAKDTGKPFCLSVSFKAPHTPNNPDPEFDTLFKSRSWSKLENFGPENAKSLAPQSRRGRQSMKYFKQMGYKDDYKNSYRRYFQLIYGIDQALGMIRKKLKENKQDKNTIIIFTSDNGYHLGSHGFGGKILPYENGTRVPLIIFDPRRFDNGKRHNGLTSNVDFAPTILQAAGIKPMKEMDGQSLLDRLNNMSVPPEYIPQINVYGSEYTTGLGIVTKNFRYNYWWNEKKEEAAEELFDRKEDQLETENLAGNKKHKKTLKMMRSYYDQALKHWKENAVDHNNYQIYAELFDRNIPWQKKADKIPQMHVKAYQRLVKQYGEPSIK